MSLRNALRAGTAENHAVVDDAFAHFDLSDRVEYGAFLSAHARAIPAWESMLEIAGIDTLISDWAERRRADLLLADLEALGLDAPPLMAAKPLAGADALWGAAYVLEGSKLGGSVLARSVPDAFPARYLRFQGPKGAMKVFMEQLDGHQPDDAAAAIDAARLVFASFRDAAARERESMPA